MVLLIDNFDSFTWNLAAQIKKAGAEVLVFRNNEISIKEIRRLNPEGVILSPGPGRPEDSGICPDLLDTFSGEIPILGVCLGHQLIGGKLGLKLVHSNPPVHGKASAIFHDGRGVFQGISEGTLVMRYHSLILKPFVPNEKIELTAKTSTGEVMGIRNKFLKLEGVQFHPESILTPEGDLMMENWLTEICR